jgi:hypothetical protein
MDRHEHFADFNALVLQRRPSQAPDPEYGSDPDEQLTNPQPDPSKPIPLDELEGAQPEQEMRGDTECLTCGLGAKDCVCKREGA